MGRVGVRLATVVSEEIMRRGCVEMQNFHGLSLPPE
jgi:hypothetical protein